MKHIMHEEIYRSGEVPRYERPRRRRTGRIAILIVLIILLVGGLGITIRMLNPTPVSTSTETRTFHLSTGTQPTLIVSDTNGFVHVYPGAENAVTIMTTKVGDGFGASPDNFKVSYSQSGNIITIQVSNDSIHPFDFSTASQADLDVTVPARSDLKLDTNSGEISVAGIQGKMTLTSNSGSLQATDVSLKSASLLSTNSGSITMRGSIGTLGRYMFQANSGAVDVILPRTASFHANLTSNSGTITNDFPIAPARGSDPTGRAVSGDVGSSPQAIVTIQSDSGSLHLGQL